MKTNDKVYIEILAWNHIIISMREEYLKPYNAKLFVFNSNTWYYITEEKFLRNSYTKNINRNIK